jgi:hypothetical protein
MKDFFTKLKNEDAFAFFLDAFKILDMYANVLDANFFQSVINSFVSFYLVNF